MWTAPIETLPPAWARVNLDAVTARHPYPITDKQVGFSQFFSTTRPPDL